MHLTTGPSFAGAAKGVILLHNALNELGVDSNLILVGNPEVHAENSKITSVPLNAWEAIASLLGSRVPAKVMKAGAHNFSFCMEGLKDLPDDISKNVDILHCHWIAGGRVQANKIFETPLPVVWTFRDMWPFTGGCHYSLHCLKYTSGCRSCPQLKKPFEGLVRFSFEEKKRLHKRRHIAYTAISSWLSDVAESSLILSGKKVQHIENCISDMYLDEFLGAEKPVRPMEVSSVSKGFHANNKGKKRKLLVGCQNLNDPYKGMDIFIDSLKLLNPNDYEIHVFGAGEILVPNWTAHYYGFVNEERRMRELYRACDLFVFPSRQEAFGKTVVEALASGAGVVCLPGTGASEIIHTDMRAVVCEDATAPSLAKAIVDYFERASTLKLELTTLERYRPRVVAQKYMNLYSRLLESTK